MNTDSLLASIETFANRLFELSDGNEGEIVVACPGWKMKDLLAHIGIVYGAVAGVIEEGSLERPATPFPTPPDEEVHAWALGNYESMMGTLKTNDPSTPVWTWGKEQNVAWFVRRMTHETLLHMWDAETPVTDHITVDGEVACDGVDEYIDGALQFSANPKKVFKYPNGSIHLHRTDGSGEWLLENSEDGLLVRREHAKGDVAVRGNSMNLLLFLWGRNPDGLEIFGDVSVAKEWASLAP